MKSKSKKIAMLAMFSAIAFIVMVVGRIPIILFLKYDPKDVVITICGFIFGPLSALTVSVVVSLAEMITVSDNGILGCLMNIISTASFACTASAIYQKYKNKKGVVLGLICGCLTMSVVMIFWNYIIAPIYMRVPRREVVKLLISAFLPFNLIKGGLNSAFALMLYKPLLDSLKKNNIINDFDFIDYNDGEKSHKGILLLSITILFGCVLFILAFNGKL